MSKTEFTKNELINALNVEMAGHARECANIYNDDQKLTESDIVSIIRCGIFRQKRANKSLYDIMCEIDEQKKEKKEK